MTPASEAAPGRDMTASVLGSHPFAVRVFFGDDRLQAYVADARGASLGPGVLVHTPVAERALSEVHQVSRARLHEAARRLGVDLAFLVNAACQTPLDRYLERLRATAAASGHGGIFPDDRPVVEALKSAVEQAGAIGPQAIVRAAMAFLAEPPAPGVPAYARLVEIANRVLTNPARNPRTAQVHAPIAGIDDIAAAGLDLWWIKEGSATIVFQAQLHLAGGRPPVRFVLNVAKDVTGAADELRQVHGDFLEFFRMDPGLVMECLGQADVRVPTWRGEVAVPVLAAEWFEGHELHVYESGPQLHVWQDQRMGRDHPLPAAVSDSIWRETIRMRARLTRRSAWGLVPACTWVNAGDYIFRQRDGGAWDVLLIWSRRAPPGVPPADFIVATALFAGVNVFGAEAGPTVWWDQPAEALAALRAGLAAAGLTPAEITALLREALAGAFTRYAEDPRQLAWITLFQTAEAAGARAVFARARSALAAAVA